MQPWLTSIQFNKPVLSIFNGSLVSFFLKKSEFLGGLVWPCAMCYLCKVYTCVLLFKNPLDSLEMISDAEPHFQKDSLILGSKSSSADLCTFFKMV